MSAPVEPSSRTSPQTTPLALRGRVVRGRRWSFRVDERTAAVCLLLGLATVAAGVLSISVGEFPLSVREVLAALLGRGTEEARLVVGSLRLPRTLTGILVGAALGASGAIFQSIARNPLGSPDIIGLNAGAAVGAVLVIISFPDAAVGVVGGAMLGGAVTAVAVYTLAYKNGLQAYRLVLVGIGVGFAASAVVDYLLTRGDINSVSAAAVWLRGSLNGASWQDVATVGIGLAVLAPLALAVAPTLERLALGDESATSLGVRVGPSKLVLVLVGTALAALAVAAAGPVAFVAFVAGPVARRLTASPGASLVPAACVGALLTTIADHLASHAFGSISLPVGIVTAMIGAPYLLWLLSRQMRTGDL